MFVVFGVAYSFGAFFESMSDEFGASSGATSAVFSLTAFCYYSLGFVSGRRWIAMARAPLAGRRDARRALPHGRCGSPLARVHDPRAWRRCRSGLWLRTHARLGGRWFERRRGTALGIAVAGIGVERWRSRHCCGDLALRLAFNVGLGVASAALLLACAALATRPPRPLARRDRSRWAGSPVLLRSSCSMSLDAAGLAGVVRPVRVPAAVRRGGDASSSGGPRRCDRSCQRLWAAGDRSSRRPIRPTVELSGLLRRLCGQFSDLARRHRIHPARRLRGRAGSRARMPRRANPRRPRGDIWRRPSRPTGRPHAHLCRHWHLVGPLAAGFVVDVTGSYRWAIAGCFVLAIAGLLALLPLSPQLVVATVTRP